MGFIKFGSRVDVLLPVGTELNVKLNQLVKGGVTVLATIETVIPVEKEVIEKERNIMFIDLTVNKEIREIRILCLNKDEFDSLRSQENEFIQTIN